MSHCHLLEHFTAADQYQLILKKDCAFQKDYDRADLYLSPIRFS